MQIESFEYPRNNEPRNSIYFKFNAMPSPQDKANIRRRYLTKRNALTADIQKNASKALCARIETLPAYQHTKKIALYHAFDGEISLTPLWRSAEAAGKTCYMPVIIPQHKTLLFLPQSLQTPHKKNKFQILEPDIPHHHAIALKNLDLMIVPLVAFDTHGTRLGRGAGYYDHTLAHERPTCLLGAAYEFQQQPTLERAAWDIPLDGIVTEKNTYWSTP